MKKISIFIFLWVSLLLASCSSGYNTQKNLELMRFTDSHYTTEQQEYGLDLLIKLQEKEIQILEEELANKKEEIEKTMGYYAGLIVRGTIKSNNTEVYRAKQDEILAKEQEIEQLQEELKKAKEKAGENLGFEKKDELTIDYARRSFYDIGK